MKLRHVIESKIKESNGDNQKINIQHLTKNFDSIRHIVDEEVYRLSHLFTDYADLGKDQNSFYAYRQELVSAKSYLMDLINVANKDIKELKRKIVFELDTGGENDFYKAKNKLEQEVKIDSSTKNIALLIDTLDNIIDYLSNSISGIDKMIFGFNYIKDFAQYRKVS